MTGIYSHPIQYPTQPENGMRAINGERPLCFNRPNFPPGPTEHAQTCRSVTTLLLSHPPQPAPCDCGARPKPRAMSSDCRAWAVRAPDKENPADTGEDPATESIPGRESWRCWGCRHLPQDPRVIARAKQAEAL